MIPALNPAVLPEKVSSLADWCNEHNYNHYHFLYVSSMLAADSLLHYVDEDRLDYIGLLINSTCPNHKLQFLTVLFTLKSLLFTSRPPCAWFNEYNSGCHYASINDIQDLAATCQKNGLAAVELFDVAICRALVEELVVNRSPDGEKGDLNWSLLINAVEAAKVVGQGLKGVPMEDRIGVLLLVLQTMTGNILCASSDYN